MEELKLSINMLPKGAWNNDFSKTLSKKDWDKLREFALKRANGQCEICSYKTDELDVHEEWDFDLKKKTQTLTKIIAICSRCHGVKHFKNSVRLGFGEEAQKHFIKVNNASEIQFASHLNKALLEYEQRNRILRWKIVADLNQFGGNGIEIKQINIPFIKNPYEKIEWNKISYSETKDLFEYNPKILLTYWYNPPKIKSIYIDNYQGLIKIICNETNKIEWHLDGQKIKTKYNTAGQFITALKVKNLTGKLLNFKLIGVGGETISKSFELLPQEAL